jgi:hypothetical protein
VAQETKKIKEAGLDRDREQEVLAQLLHKETKLLQTIDRLKINANHENKDLRVQHTLGKMSQVRQQGKSSFSGWSVAAASCHTTLGDSGIRWTIRCHCITPILFLQCDERA